MTPIKCWSTFSFLSRGIILWIELPWPENLANTYAWHTETLNNCFDLIRSHQQCIPWSPPLEIEPANTDCRAKTLQLSHQSILHISDMKLTSHGNCTANLNVSCKLKAVLFTEDTVTSRATFSDSYTYKVIYVFLISISSILELKPHHQMQCQP